MSTVWLTRTDGWTSQLRPPNTSARCLRPVTVWNHTRPPDGYTLLATATSNFINATLYKKLPYNFLRDIQPVASISRTPLVMAAFPVDPVMVLFLVYVTIHELSLLFDDGELYRSSACAHPRPSLRGAGAFVCLCVSTD